MIKLKINGQEQNWDGDPDLPLLWFLRDEAGLTGTKYGCGQALCGACTVFVDKQAVRACITSVSDVVGREVTTIEGAGMLGGGHQIATDSKSSIYVAATTRGLQKLVFKGMSSLANR